MQVPMLLLFVSLLYLANTSQGLRFGHIYLSPFVLPSRLLPTREASLPDAKLPKRKSKPSQGLAPAPAPGPAYQGAVVAPHHRFKHRHHRHRHHHRLKPSPSPERPGCGTTCSEPLAPTPLGTPCGCVLPMKVRLLLSKAVYVLFPEVNELEIEIASGVYLKHNQVQIVGATADSGNQDRTLVDINLVPLGEKFDNTTAMLTYERFWRKEVPLNRTLFGNYDVVYVNYTGIPSPYPTASGPEYPISADLADRKSVV